MPGDTAVTLLGIPVNWIVQGLIGAFIFFWAYNEARKTYHATTEQLRPNPIVAGVSMAWDRDMQERFLQLMERMATAAEIQAKHQSDMAGSWETLADRQKLEMKERFDELLSKLDRVEARSTRRKDDDMSAMVTEIRREAAGRRQRPRRKPPAS